jgi:hypothetical protein
MHRAARRQVFGQIAPLAAGAQDVHHPVDHLAQVDPPLAAARLPGAMSGSTSAHSSSVRSPG